MSGEKVEVVRGWRTYQDGSQSPIERWVRCADGDWVSLDSNRRTSGDIQMDPQSLGSPGCPECGNGWCPGGPLPAPEPSEVAETTAGERKPWCLCMPGIGPHDDGCPAATPDAAEPDAGEVGGPAWMDVVRLLGEHQRTLDGAGSCRCGSWPPPGYNVGWNVHLADMLTPALAAHVSAAETKARGDERERIAEAIEAETVSLSPRRRRAAARIARGDA